MRLHQEQLNIIHQAAAEMFGSDARVYLFGSRTNDELRGGDIDLLIELDSELENRASSAARFAARLQRQLGDQRIDVVISDPQTLSQPIHRIAKETGIRI